MQGGNYITYNLTHGDGDIVNNTQVSSVVGVDALGSCCIIE